MPLPPDPTSPTYDSDSRTTSFRSPNNSPEVLPSVLPNVHPIVSQWQQLASMDRQSSGFLLLLLSLTTGASRSSTAALRGENAKITLGALDEVGRLFFEARKWQGGNLYYIIPQLFGDGKVPKECQHDTLSMMRLLAYDSSQVPPRYQVEPHALSVEDGVVANGASSNIRKGRLGDKTVAVKTLRTDRGIDLHDVQKVSHPSINL